MDNGHVTGFETLSGEQLAELIESAAWLQLDVADYLRLSQSDNQVERQGRDVLKRKVIRQLRQHEQEGDPLEIVTKIRPLLQTA